MKLQCVKVDCSCTTWEARMCHNWLHLFTRPHTQMHKAVKANLLRVCKCSKLKMVLTAVCGKKRGWKLRSVGVVRVESFPGKDSVQAHGAQPPLTEILKILKKYNNYVVIPSFFSKAPKIKIFVFWIFCVFSSYSSFLLSVSFIFFRTWSEGNAKYSL